jgi:hypothetical protein
MVEGPTVGIVFAFMSGVCGQVGTFRLSHFPHQASSESLNVTVYYGRRLNSLGSQGLHARLSVIHVSEDACGRFRLSPGLKGTTLVASTYYEHARSLT